MGDYPGLVFLFSTEFPHRLSAPFEARSRRQNNDIV